MSAPASRALVVEVEQAQPMALSAQFRCAPGEMLALVGPSGAGKTSMLRIMAGLMRPAHGRVLVGEQVWCDTASGVFVPPQKRHVGLVFQNYALMPHLSALDNVALALMHLPREQRRERARRWLDHVRLTPGQQARRPTHLSGGEQQRVAVARALAREPALLLLDEPFSAVDQMSRHGLYALLAELRRELDIPIVLVTHDLNEARLLCDQLVVIDAGRVLQQGAPASIHRAPRNARVADLVGIQNRFHGVWLGPDETSGQTSGEGGWGLLRWTDGMPGGATDEGRSTVLRVRDKGRLAPGQAVSWVIHGEGIHLLDAPSQASGDFCATVAELRHLGEITLVTLLLEPAPGASLRLTLSGPQAAPLAPGQRTCVRLDMALVHVMPVRNAG
ncbi:MULTISPECIES: ABC transporter ATP-binding protein [unclassified Polaromonas]|jgi:molybdate transport system ATP-binding protein|uniref:ABC transporter ATP-binding protein n=1 Tax=unclassified Polaromonas TaxID=2638319 RepID=UPI000BD750C4|nr:MULTISPECIES: ABC transporter ATP-binding protein [unclassified Polaromonas]OYY35078.1 MAG: ABC transporter [Polaromonas sp. 35-63-35]OYZ20217.1 MAG: ABC transporter [Polaromonas sp. 16-63-31]OYZ77972.1 MAG: ABC transporter [Polaromonas sp. 24-63-21]OZA49482.1 MAG: ABC transporter [Polaromonas sp. 17-63-33]HQR99527.1 ABC transporter ATP-binding protein [Polaromonas sp.]